VVVNDDYDGNDELLPRTLPSFGLLAGLQDPYLYSPRDSISDHSSPRNGGPDPGSGRARRMSFMWEYIYT
jgi:hypothetical protein